MNGKDIINKVMTLRGMSQQTLSEKLGYKHQSGVSERLRNKQDLRADTLAKFLAEMDCSLVVRSNLKDKTEWVIDGREGEQ